MLDACVMMIARNADDYIEPCIRVLAPHVKKVRVALDSRSTDGTFQKIERLSEQFENIFPYFVEVQNPLVDLVVARNRLLQTEEPWGFIVDSDEYHQNIANYRFGKENAYALQCWAVWNETHAHRSSSRARIGRVFRNSKFVHWRGLFGREILYNGNTPVFTDPKLLPYRYIHFTHLKKDSWRSELHQERVADGKFLSPMPESIISTIKKIHEDMSHVPQWRV